MPKWTEAQSEAIKNRGCNLLVSAAAGSGKTAVLVERIIKLIVEDKIDIDKLLIVTFTNAAAGEMRERILKAITDEMEKENSDEKNLRKQVSLINKASITTLHSFCINVVRKNFHIIGIDPTFRIGDTTEIRIIAQESIEEVLESKYEQGEKDFLRLVESFSGNKSDIKIEELVLSIYLFIQSQPYPYKWLKESVEMFNMDRNELNESTWIQTIKEDINTKLKGAKNIIEEAIAISKQAGGPEPYLEALNQDLIDIEKLESMIEDYVLGNIHVDDMKIEHTKLKTITKKMISELEIDEVLKAEVYDLRNEYKDIINELFSKNILKRDMDSYFEDVKDFYPVMNSIYELVVSFGELYSEKKLEKGLLDFNDLEHYTLQALESEDVREELKNCYEYIFIDEYQDSNIVQETIIDNIKRENNLFFVGDVKQSIYRFRLADPSLFIGKYTTYSKDDESVNKRIDLSQNFRSRKEILDGVNFIFKNIMTSELGEVDYTEDAYLYNGANYEEIEDSSIEINIIEKNMSDNEERENNDSDIDINLEEMTDAEIEAKVIADKIKNLIGKSTFDIKENRYREIGYKDIVILFRATKNWSDIFSEVFTREGIPVYIDDSSGYFDVLEIKIFLNLLSIIDNKRQDIPLLSIMRSPIGKFTTEELIKIRINNKNSSYYEAIEGYIKDNMDELSEKLKNFISKIDYWCEEARYLKLDEFMWKLMMDTGYYYYVGAMPRGAQRQANLRILVDRANEFEKASINGLFNFIRFADKLQSASGEMGTAKVLGENEDVVRIMTIHKSKGLEFPVVICGGLGKQFNLKDMQQDILLHKELGLGPKHVDISKRRYRETLPQLAIKSKKKIENLSEEMRVLYVALTRAKDKLILVGSIRDIEKQAKKWSKKGTIYNLMSSRNYLDWICTCLFKHKDGKPIRDLVNIEIDGLLDIKDSSKWTVNFIDKTNIFKEKAEENKLKQEYKDKLENFKREEFTEYKKLIEERFLWNYPYENSIKIPSKISVSDIKKANMKDIDDVVYKIPSLLKIPQFLEGKKPFTSAEKGTIVHFVMQHIDLKSDISLESIKLQIEKMTFHELITDEEAKVVDVEKILKFFDSSIGKRMLNSEKSFREVPFVYRKDACKVIEELNNCSEDVYIQGIVDCYFEEDGDIVLLDYKTDYVGENPEKLISKYKSQLKLYKEAIENITKKE
ncbi:ATP-dependent helicase/deoxyribonuclease, subunit A [Gottschalkia acidurici 9a]|uniref:ATP-dependent helicase/nuclease subunit A n=1 Tax=Gottschalkia acidurici (strain ATCC 7906 / DSM 604 / BCRC 14475 / CIP 104303 / KCTC 5404 / NCIMB 10678 / 9a) TaxID=1128398 RepID=K0B070_GOTA9|nr:helicase-exonuclease AddAB subunit AddA [Gottschalkia acidurici]AFS78914.1 ATP-dependent helicase/deoxyribonuclease, subunit A [Gottschalkia acidurici 9a]